MYAYKVIEYMQKEGNKMKKFNYSFLDNGLLPANLINITGTIYALKTGAKIRKDKYEKIFTELEKCRYTFISSQLCHFLIKFETRAIGIA